MVVIVIILFFAAIMDTIAPSYFLNLAQIYLDLHY